MNIALLTAAGVGNRMGQDIPKQFMHIDNCPVIIYTMLAFQHCDEIDAIAVVCLKGWEVMLRSYANQYSIDKLNWIFEGADTNQGSIENGVMGLKNSGCSDDDIILVHDGVRPLVSNEIIHNNIEVCKQYGYAVTGLTCKEAIMELIGECVHQIEIPRERLIRTQTPHTYRLRTLIDAHKEARKIGVRNTVASCTLLSILGVDNQCFVKGSEKNGLKLTNPEDVELFKSMKNTDPEPWMK